MKLYISALIILIAVLVAHIAGLDGPYYTIKSYDIFMHLLGGVGIGLFAAAMLQSYQDGILLNRRNLVAAVIAVGIVWELFEIYYNLTGHPLWSKLYYIDTVKDLIMDIIGGSIVAYFTIKHYRYVS